MASDNDFNINLWAESDAREEEDEEGDLSELGAATTSLSLHSEQHRYQREETDQVSSCHVIGLSGGVAIDSIVTGINYGSQKVTVKGSDPMKQKAKKILDRTISRICDWTKGMVQTSALEEVLQKLTTGTQWITIKGSPGEGKTTVAYMALDELHRKGGQVFQVTSPEEFSEVTMIFPESVIMLDDIFGNLEFSTAQWSKWKPVLHQVLGLIEHACRSHERLMSSKKDVTVILVGRDYVLNSASCDMGRMSDFFTQTEHVVTMSQQTERNLEEKLSILKAVSEATGANLDETITDKICRINCPHGFPHVCRLFLTMRKSNPELNVEVFFKTPLEFLNQTIALFTRDKLKLFLFKEMVKGNGNVSARELGQLKSGSEVLLAAFDLVGTYLKKEEDCFLFDHPSVYDSVAYNLRKLYPQFVIENCNLSFIHERIRIQFSQDIQTSASEESYLVAYIPRVYSEDLAKRFAIEIMNKHLHQVLSHRALTEEEFVRKVMSYITIPLTEMIHMYDWEADECFLSLVASNKSPRLLQYIENQKIFPASQDDIDTVLLGVCNYAASDVLTYLIDTHTTLDINCRFDEHQTPLMIAAETRHNQFVHHVMSLGPDLDAHDMWGKTVLIYFCKNGLLSAVKSMSDRGTDIDKMDGEGRSPLYFACSDNQVEIVRFLLDRGVRIDDKAVDMACYMGNMVIVRWLFEGGARVNTLSGWGTPLHSACHGDHISVITFLIGKGASVNASGLSEMSPLHIACRDNKFKALRCLLENGAVNESKDDYGDTPLHSAADNDSHECIRLLLEAGADVNVQNTNGLTPLHKASMNSKDSVDILLKSGASTSVENKDGNTPLHTAAMRGNDECITTLLVAGAVVNLQSKDGSTPLQNASRAGSKASVDVLLKAGADAQLQNERGHTALHKASIAGSSECVVLLLKAGVDVNAQSKDGSTPLHISRRNCVDVLVKEGADVNVQNKDQQGCHLQNTCTC